MSELAIAIAIVLATVWLVAHIAWLRRLWDAWQHPGEYQRQRVRRRYLDGLRLAEKDAAQLHIEGSRRNGQPD